MCATASFCDCARPSRAALNAVQIAECLVNRKLINAKKKAA